MILSKTEDLNANVEKKIEFNGGLHLKIKNLGEDTVYISQHSSIVASADGVKSIQAQTTDIVTDVAKYSIEGSVGDYRGTIYALATKDCQIELEATNNPNFNLKLKGGGEVIASNTLDNTLKDGRKYQLGILSSDITLTLPERANDDIEVDFAIADTPYAVNCDYLSLNVVANTYYQVVFSHDKALNTYFASIISSDYTQVSTTAEVIADETT